MSSSPCAPAADALSLSGSVVFGPTPPEDRVMEVLSLFDKR